MPGRLELSPQAQQEVAAATAWYEEQSPGLGLEFVSELDRALSTVATTPSRWRQYPHLPELQQYSLKRFPYAVIYCQQRDLIMVIAVAHLRRKPGYWR